MGLLDDYNIDMNEVNEAGYGKTFPDDWYEGVIGSVHIQRGSKNNPDASWLIIGYLLEPDNDKFDELFGLPLDPRAPTPQELDKVGFLKRRLKELGVPEGNLNEVDEDDLVGTRVKFELVTTYGKKGTRNEGKPFQNIRNLSVLDGDEPAAAPVAEKPAAKKAPAKAAPKAAPKTAVENPFA